MSEQTKTRKEANGGTRAPSVILAHDLQVLGYDLWLNDLTDEVHDDEKRFDDVARAVLDMTLRARGYAGAMLGAIGPGVIAQAAKQRRHPMREYLDTLTWDGADHIAQLSSFISCAGEPIHYPDGTQRTAFHAFFRRWLVGAVAKIRGDGDACRGNFVLTLAGRQGAGKSHLASWLCPNPAWFVDKGVNPDDKDDRVKRSTVLVWEIGELGATTKRADVEALKGFITAPTVSERKAYGRTDTQKPAIASYIGTVNSSGFLADDTGNRRFAVADVAGIDWAYTKVNRRQMWAQAVALWNADSTSWRLSEQEVVHRDEANRAHGVVTAVGEALSRAFTPDSSDTQAWNGLEILDRLRLFGGLMAGGDDNRRLRELAGALRDWGIEVERKRDKVTGKIQRVYTGLTPVTL